MRALYTRLFSDEHGASHFADVHLELSIGFSALPADPLHFAQLLVPDGSFWIGARTNWRGDAAHPAPRRAIFVTTHGKCQVTTSDGATRRFPPGRVLLVEDTTGAGHSTEITSDEDCFIFAVGLPP